MAHKALFSIVYGLTVPLNAFHEGRETYLAFYYTQNDLNYSRFASLLSMVSAIGAYAEYYGGLPQVSPGLVDMLFSHPHTWLAVARYPSSFFMLAKKLRHTELYFDSLHHLMAHASANGYAKISQLFDITNDEARNWISPMVQDNVFAERDLERSLYRLHLSDGFAVEDGIRSTPKTTYLNMMEYKQDSHRYKFSEATKSYEKSKLLAGNSFTQYVARQVSGGETYFHNTPRERAAGSMANAIYTFRRAATWKKLANMFDKSSRDGKTATEQYAEDFAHGDPGVKWQMEIVLKALV